MVLLLALGAADAKPAVALVILDPEAREEGYALTLDGWRIDDALPVEVARGEAISLVDPDGRAEPLDVAGGEAWEIAGPKGEAWMSLLEEEIRTDVVLVQGDRRAIAALAVELGAELATAGEFTVLSAPGLLFDLPWVEGVDRRQIERLRYVRVDEGGREAPAPVAPVRTALGRRELPRPSRVSAPVAATPTAAAVPERRAAVPAAPLTVSPPAPDPGFAAEARSERDREHYSGTYLCRDTLLVLDPSGVYAVGADRGVWSVGAPGVVRMYGPNGQLWYRAAFEPAGVSCRAVW